MNGIESPVGSADVQVQVATGCGGTTASGPTRCAYLRSSAPGPSRFSSTRRVRSGCPCGSSVPVSVSRAGCGRTTLGRGRHDQRGSVRSRRWRRRDWVLVGPGTRSGGIPGRRRSRTGPRRVAYLPTSPHPARASSLSRSASTPSPRPAWARGRPGRGGSRWRTPANLARERGGRRRGAHRGGRARRGGAEGPLCGRRRGRERRESAPASRGGLVTSALAYAPRQSPLGRAAAGAAAIHLWSFAVLAFAVTNPIVLGGCALAVVIAGGGARARGAGARGALGGNAWDPDRGGERARPRSAATRSWSAAPRFRSSGRSTSPPRRSPKVPSWLCESRSSSRPSPCTPPASTPTA